MTVYFGQLEISEILNNIKPIPFRIIWLYAKCSSLCYFFTLQFPIFFFFVCLFNSVRQKMKGKWTHSKDWALAKQLIGSWESYWENSASFQLFNENWLLLNDILKSCVYNHGTCIMQPSFKVGGTCEIVLEKKLTWIYTLLFYHFYDLPKHFLHQMQLVILVATQWNAYGYIWRLQYPLKRCAESISNNLKMF